MEINTIIEIIQSGNMDRFYKCKEWLDTRAEAISRDNNECQMCKENGKVGPAQCVHHKKHLKKNPGLAFNLDNLVTLCNICHNKEHPEKFNNPTRKPRVNIEERW